MLDGDTTQPPPGLIFSLGLACGMVVMFILCTYFWRGAFHAAQQCRRVAVACESAAQAAKGCK